MIGKAAYKFDNSVFNSVEAGAVSTGNFIYELNSAVEKMQQHLSSDLKGVTLVSEQNATAAAVKDAMISKAEAADEESAYSALYFHGSTHGSPLTLGGMICGWPTAAYPSSEAEESNVLESVRMTMEKMMGSFPVAAIVIEPTQ